VQSDVDCCCGFVCLEYICDVIEARLLCDFRFDDCGACRRLTVTDQCYLQSRRQCFFLLLARALQALIDPCCLSLSTCLSATLMLNILETK